MSVAILARGGFRASGAHGAAVIRIVVNLGFDAMASGARNRSELFSVGDFCGVLVARHAEVAPMDGCGKRFYINIRRVRVFLPVAHQTIIVPPRGQRRDKRIHMPRDDGREQWEETIFKDQLFGLARDRK